MFQEIPKYSLSEPEYKVFGLLYIERKFLVYNEKDREYYCTHLVHLNNVYADFIQYLIIKLIDIPFNKSSRDLKPVGFCWQSFLQHKCKQTFKQEFQSGTHDLSNTFS